MMVKPAPHTKLLTLPAMAKVKAHRTRGTPRNRVFLWPATVFVQPNTSSIRLRMRWLTA